MLRVRVSVFLFMGIKINSLITAENFRIIDMHLNPGVYFEKLTPIKFTDGYKDYVFIITIEDLSQATSNLFLKIPSIKVICEINQLDCNSDYSLEFQLFQNLKPLKSSLITVSV